MRGLRRVIGLVLATVVLAGCSAATTNSVNPAAKPVLVTFEADAGTVLIGTADAPTMVDVYEDFLCPYCWRFEHLNADLLEDRLKAGTIKVRYHLLNLLDADSKPPGYSGLAANAALTVAKLSPGQFIAYHTLLFDKQPDENGPGYTEDQLIQFAREVGIDNPHLTAAVKAGTYKTIVSENLRAAEQNQQLWQKGQGGSMGFGTPTVQVNGKVINWTKSDWFTSS